MKKIYNLIIILSLFCIHSKGQYVFIADGLFQSKLMALYPGCFNNLGQLDTTCTAIITEDSLIIEGDGSGFQLMSISGIEYFDNLRTLDCSGNSLSNIFKLPPLLETLDCSSQINGGFINWYQFGDLPTLPPTLRRLDIHDNGFSSLPALNAGLTWLDCSSNHYHSSQGGSMPLIPLLQNLVALPASLLYLNCSGNRLTSLPDLPSSLQYLDARNNKFYYVGILMTYDFPGIACLPPLPASLQTLLISVNNLYCLPNIVPGMTADITLPVCNTSNDVNNCLGLFSPLIVATPDTITGLVIIAGVPSNSASYNLSATNLTPASGNITITPSSFLQISLDNVSFSSTALLVPYDSGRLLTTPVYVRIGPGAPPGPFSGIITNSAAGAPSDTVNISGDALRQYYNTKANLGLNNPGTWSSTVDGTGVSPLSLSAAYQQFNIINETNAGYTGIWDVSGLNSKIVVGDGIIPIVFTIPYADSNRTIGKIDVMSNATLRILNRNLPALNFMAGGSTVDIARLEINPFTEVYIPPVSFYNLRVANSSKVFSRGTTTIRNNLVVDSVVNLRGDGNGFDYSRVNCFGDVSFINGTFFSNHPSQEDILLKMNGPGPVQNIFTDGDTIKLFSLDRDSAVASTINISAGTHLELGSEQGGGLFIRSPNTTLSTSGGSISFVQLAKGSLFNGSSKINSNGTSFYFFNGSYGGSDYPEDLPPGFRNLAFTANSTVKELRMNVNVATASIDHLTISDNIEITDSLILINGRIITTPGVQINLRPTAGLRGGNQYSFVDGLLKRTGPGDFIYVVGNGYKRYRPVAFTNHVGNNDYTVEYKYQNFSNYTIDPATLALYPDYSVSGREFWNITPAAPGGSVDLAFHYTDNTSQVYAPNQLRIAHFDGTDWDDIGGVPDPTNTTANGKVTVTGVSIFSPFSFSGATGVVVPVKLSNFSVRKQHTTVQISWTTEQEINSKEFVVERLIDGIKWDEINRVNASGNSSQKISYSITDFNPFKGINYYRLKQIDLDNRAVYSQIKSVYFGKDADVVLIPNPARDKVRVYLPGNSTMATIQIFNLNGQLIKAITSTDESLEINLADISRGIYTIKVTGKNINEVKKLVVD